MIHVVLLDNEAVQALHDPSHPKRRAVVAHAQVVAVRKRRADPIDVAVPTTVGVEAGWDGTAPGWAFANRLRIRDVTLDRVQAAEGVEAGAISMGRRSPTHRAHHSTLPTRASPPDRQLRR